MNGEIISLETAKMIQSLKKENESAKKCLSYLKYQLTQLDFYKDSKAKILCAMAIALLEGNDNGYTNE